MTDAPRFRTNSIYARLTMMNMFVSAVALLLACTAFFIYDQITFRHTLERMLSAQAQIVGFNSISAIRFDDPEAASSTLSALRDFEDIVAASIFTADRRPLARYTRQPSEMLTSVPPLAPGKNEQYWFAGGRLTLVRQMVSGGKTIGFVSVKADLHEVDQRLRHYALIAVGVLLISWVATLLISASFRQSVAQPIMQLADVARQISRDKDYTVRAPATVSNDEVRILIKSFNTMLRELQKSHEELEQRVSDRTRELVAANSELDAFASAVSHDLRGPLEAVNGYAYLLTETGKLDAQMREQVASIRSAAKRMLELIEGLLYLSRMSSSGMVEEKVDLSATAHAITNDLLRTSPDRKVEFVARETQAVYGDARLLRIMMDNLLRNAWKYTSHRDHARIEFGQLERDGQVIYFVRDSGSGFDPRSAGRLFQPFQRLHSEKEFPGHGIGLATVRRIIRRHGGEVWAEGAVEKGATFYFTLGSSRVSSSMAADDAVHSSETKQR